jgi:hypothetical protein
MGSNFFLDWREVPAALFPIRTNEDRVPVITGGGRRQQQNHKLCFEPWRS